TVPHRPEPDHAARALPRARRDREPDRVPVQPEVLGHERHGGSGRRRCADLDALTPVPVAAARGRAKILPAAARGRAKVVRVAAARGGANVLPAEARGRAKVLPVAAARDGAKILPYTWPQPALRAEATQGARSSLAAQRGGGVTPSRTAP